MWWLVSRGHPEFMAAGHLGQFLHVNPPARIIIVRLGKSTGGLSRAEWGNVFVSLSEQIGLTVSTTTEAQQGAAMWVPRKAKRDFRIDLETGPVHLSAVTFALDGGTWSMGVLHFAPNPGAWGVRSPVDRLLGGSGWGIRTHRMRGNTLQPLIKIAVASSWIIREYLTALHAWQGDYQAGMLELQK